MTGHEVSAASQEGLCILACISGAIAHLWPVFLLQHKIDTVCFTFNRPVLMQVDYFVNRLTCFGH